MPKSHFEFISGLALKSGALAVALVMTASFAVMFLVGVVPTPQAFYVSGVILAGLIVAARAEGKILVTELALIYLVKMFRGFALSA